MTVRSQIVVDAGPAITFLARRETTRVLIQGLRGGFSSPETVREEVIRKSRQDKRRFGATENQWTMLENANRITILSDDETDQLSAAVQRLCNMPMSERMRQGKDLGELMVIAHAAVLAEAGHHVTILIQEHAGTQMAKLEGARIARLKSTQGSIRVWDSQTVLLNAAGSPEIPDKATMRRIYQSMHPLDAALPPIDQTNLLTSPLWESGEGA